MTRQIDLFREKTDFSGLFDEYLIRHRTKYFDFLPHTKRLIRSLCKNETRCVIFVFRNLSTFERRLFNACLAKSDLPTVKYQIGKTTDGSGQLHGLIRDNAFFFMEIGIRNTPEILSQFQALLQLPETLARNVTFLPALILWNRNPVLRTRFPRMQFLLYGKRGCISTGKQVNLRTFQEQHKELAHPDVRLARLIRRNIGREMKVITSVPLEPISSLSRRILKTKHISDVLQSVAQSTKRSPDEIRKEALGYIKEIAARYVDLAPRLWSIFVNYILRHQFDAIEFDIRGLEILRDVLREKTGCILVPTHRSHMDYVSISIGCYREGIASPNVAAGINLAFWPMGFIFRHTGAFFIRRTFRGLDIYPHIFKAYVFEILKLPQPIEVFIEGGRSRNGRLRYPKLGFINILLDAVRNKHPRRLVFLPVSINYDRVPEENTYIDELQGIPKKKEKLSEMIRSVHLLKRHYGRVYLSIADPIRVPEDIDFSSAPSEVKEKFGFKIMASLSDGMAVTPTAVVATALLNSGVSPVRESDVLKTALELLTFLRTQKVVFPEALKNPEDDAIQLRNALEFFTGNEIVAPTAAGLSISVRNRYILDYAKNSILGHLISISAAALGLLSEADREHFSVYILKLLCPYLHPVPPEHYVNTLERNFQFLEELSQEALGIFGRIITPLLALFSFSRNALLAEINRQGAVNRKTGRDILDSTMGVISSYYPECVSKDIPNTIWRILTKNKFLIAETAGKFIFPPEQMDDWNRLETLLKNLHPFWISAA